MSNSEFMETPPLRARILETVVRKSSLKQQVFDNTFAAFNLLKEVLFEMASEFDDALDGKLDRRVRIECRALRCRRCPERLLRHDQHL